MFCVSYSPDPAGMRPVLPEDRFHALVAFLGHEHLMRLLVDPEVAGTLLFLLPRELWRDLVQAVVHLDVVVGLSRDDERRARLVDEDRVHFVDDRVAQAALHALADREHHVVAQVVEAELVVRAVGDVGGVRGLLVRVAHLREVHADRQAEELEDAPHPVGVALGEVVVDRDDMHALAGQRVEVRGQGRYERLAFARAHFRDLSVVQRHPADQLHIEVAHRERALACFAHDRERLRQHVVERFAVGHTRLELVGLRAEVGVGELGDVRLERVDLLEGLRVLLEQALVAAAEDAGEDVGDHGWTGGGLGPKDARCRRYVPAALPKNKG